MITFMNTWAKNLGLAIVVISILEMLLPNNKIKKYIRMVMGIYILFCILSPWIQDKDIIQNNIENLATSVSTGNTFTNVSNEVNQTSMNERIQELYVEELEKDIRKKLKEQGYEISKCKVDANISDVEDETKIKKISIKVAKKTEEIQNENNAKENSEQNESIENKIVTHIQKIKTIDTSISKIEEKQNNQKEDEKQSSITKVDIQNIKKFLIEEYGVKEKCLEIN